MESDANGKLIKKVRRRRSDEHLGISRILLALLLLPFFIAIPSDARTPSTANSKRDPGYLAATEVVPPETLDASALPAKLPPRQEVEGSFRPANAEGGHLPIFGAAEIVTGEASASTFQHPARMIHVVTIDRRSPTAAMQRAQRINGRNSTTTTSTTALPSTVPEPSVGLLLLSAASGVALLGRRRRRE